MSEQHEPSYYIARQPDRTWRVFRDGEMLSEEESQTWMRENNMLPFPEAPESEERTEQ